MEAPRTLPFMGFEFIKLEIEMNYTAQRAMLRGADRGFLIAGSAKT
jgi:hypothetical protein